MPLSIKTIILLFAFNLMIVNTEAHGKHNNLRPVKFSDAKIHAPSPLPDRVTLTWNSNPATTQAVTWRTDISVLHGAAEIAVANANGREMETAYINADTSYFRSDINEAHYHSVTFENLKPDTLYAYRVGDGKNWSEFFHFKTAKLRESPFSFIYFGDAQNDLKTHWSRVFREAFREAPRASFILHAGDLINEDSADAEWGEWHGAAGWVNGMTPVIATPGNHEYYRTNLDAEVDRVWRNASGDKVEVNVNTEQIGDVYRINAQAYKDRSTQVIIEHNNKNVITKVGGDIKALTGFSATELIGARFDKRPLKDRANKKERKMLSKHWRPQFQFPIQNPPEGLEETCYYIDYQGVRIISLDSNKKVKKQASWLRNVLENNPNRWTIVTFHHPIYSPAKSRDNPKLRKRWKPLLDEYRVDLVLNGHDHSYARTGELTAQQKESNTMEGYGQAYDPKIGTVYVVSVSGPKMYGLSNTAFAKKTTENTQLFQVISLAGDSLRYSAYTATGKLHDRFELQKRKGKANKLLELTPK